MITPGSDYVLVNCHFHDFGQWITWIEGKLQIGHLIKKNTKKSQSRYLSCSHVNALQKGGAGEVGVLDSRFKIQMVYFTNEWYIKSAPYT